MKMGIQRGKKREGRTKMTTSPILVKPVQYRPISSLALWVQGTFLISAIVTAVSVFSKFLQVQLVNKVIDGRYVSLAQAQANDNREAIIGRIYLAIFIISAIIFLVWVYRANKNLHSFVRPVMTYSSGWAVGWYFIPFMSLFRPYQVMNEISKASDPNIDISLDSVTHLPSSSVVGIWWALFIISNFIGNFVFRIALGSDTPSEILTASYAYIVSDVIDIVGFMITIIMVIKISQNQDLRYKNTRQIPIEEVSNGQ
jgi:hypothetical protein